MDRAKKEGLSQEQKEAFKKGWESMTPQQRDEAFRKLWEGVAPIIDEIEDAAQARARSRFVWRMAMLAVAVIAALAWCSSR